MELVDPTFGLDRIVYDIPELIHLINRSPRLPPGSAILLDDTSRAANSRKWQSAFNQAFSDVGNTFRYRRYVVGATARVSGDIDRQFRELFHITFEIKSRDLTLGVIRAKPRIPSMDTAHNVTYWRYPTVRRNGSVPVSISRVNFHPSAFQTGPMLTWSAYERKKDLFMRAHYKTLERDLRQPQGAGVLGNVYLTLNKKAGMSMRAIARLFDVSQPTVTEAIHRAADRQLTAQVEV